MPDKLHFVGILSFPTTELRPINMTDKIEKLNATIQSDGYTVSLRINKCGNDDLHIFKSICDKIDELIDAHNSIVDIDEN